MSGFEGRSIGRYHIIEKLGEGGMAVVYKAYDTHLECEVAVKVIRTENILPIVLEKTLLRFEREAKAVAKLNHPSIVSVTDYGEYEGNPYLVMPYLLGGTLKGYLKEHGKIPWQSAVKLLHPIAEALDYAHEHNVIHRDVKPSNILLTERIHPMLTDFGVAKILESGDSNTLTGTGIGIGTPEYMAPEQWQGMVTTQSDIYSLGVVFYELITDLKPFTADTPAAVLIKQISEPLVRPQTYVDRLPDSVEHFIVKAMAKKEADRYESMKDVATALENLLLKQAPQMTGEEENSEVTHLEILTNNPISDDSLLTNEGIQAEFRVNQNADKIFQNIPASENRNVKVISLGEGVEMEFIRIPAGEFLMGSDPLVDPMAKEDEQPQHKVYLDEYWIGKYPVTHGQFFRYAKSTNDNSLDWLDKSEVSPEVVNFPSRFISWDKANKFCNWLSSFIPARLPSEAEWEKAARGVNGKISSWDEISDATMYKAFGLAMPVGSLLGGISPFGVYDMVGGIWEWVDDYYDEKYYLMQNLRNPHGAVIGSCRVIRGGAWDNNISNLRAANRGSYWPSSENHNIGFRCALKI